MIPGPAVRLADRLADLPPDACREILARLDRALVAGGGDVLIRLIVEPDGQVDVELPHRYSRRLDSEVTIGAQRCGPSPGGRSHPGALTAKPEQA